MRRHDVVALVKHLVIICLRSRSIFPNHDEFKITVPQLQSLSSS
jgi:hypothetical protein